MDRDLTIYFSEEKGSATITHFGLPILEEGQLICIVNEDTDMSYNLQVETINYSPVTTQTEVSLLMTEGGMDRVSVDHYFSAGYMAEPISDDEDIEDTV